MPRGQGLDRAAREADDDDPTLERDALGRGVERLTADRIEHDVGAMASGRCFHTRRRCRPRRARGRPRHRHPSRPAPWQPNRRRRSRGLRPPHRAAPRRGRHRRRRRARAATPPAASAARRCRPNQAVWYATVSPDASMSRQRRRQPPRHRMPAARRTPPARRSSTRPRDRRPRIPSPPTERRDTPDALDARHEGQLGTHLVLTAREQHIGEVRRDRARPAPAPRPAPGRGTGTSSSESASAGSPSVVTRQARIDSGMAESTSSGIRPPAFRSGTGR